MANVTRRGKRWRVVRCSEGVEVPIERDDDLEDVSDLRLGPRRRGWLVAAMVAVGALVAASVALSDHGGDGATTTTATRQPATTAAPVTTAATVVSTPAPPSPPETSTTRTRFRWANRPASSCT